MAKYLLVYTGGGDMPHDPESMKSIMGAWTAWFGGLGSAVVDAGNPTSASKSITSGGAVSDRGAAGITGYSVLEADSLDAATKMAKGCPILQAGGGIEVYETFEIPM